MKEKSGTIKPIKILLMHSSSQMDAIVGRRKWRTQQRTMIIKMEVFVRLASLLYLILTVTNAQRAAQTNATSSYSPSTSSFQPHASYLIIASRVIRPNTLYKVR